jgi:hypothetical protein
MHVIASGQRCKMRAFLTGLAADVMGAAVEPDQALMEAGLDSLAAVELRNAVVARFGAAMPATLALDYPTLTVCPVVRLSTC